MGISGVILDISFVISSFTSISPLLTGVLSDLIFFIKPFALSSIAKSPAIKKLSIKSLTIFFKSSFLFTKLS